MVDDRRLTLFLLRLLIYLVLIVLSWMVMSRLSLVLAPLFPMRVDIPDGAFLLLPVVAIAIGLIASGAGLRRAVSVDPALAFGGP